MADTIDNAPTPYALRELIKPPEGLEEDQDLVLKVRPLGEFTWLVLGPIEAVATWAALRGELEGPRLEDQEGRLEVTIATMTTAELQALADFDGW